MIRSILAVAVLLGVAVAPSWADTTIVTDGNSGYATSDAVVIIRNKPVVATETVTEVDPYQIEGQVTKIENSRNEVTVQYEAIVERRIKVRDVHLSTLKRGDFVRIKLQDDNTANTVVQLN